MIDAALSTNRKFAICGRCGRSLARRDRIIVPDGSVVHDLVWDSDWHEVPGFGDIGPRHDFRLEGRSGANFADRSTFWPGHIERTASALDRLDRGDAPTRRGGQGGQRFDRPDVAHCPWEDCRAMNNINRKKLQLSKA